MKSVYLNSLIKREKRKKYAIGLCTDMVMRVGVYVALRWKKSEENHLHGMCSDFCLEYLHILLHCL